MTQAPIDEAPPALRKPGRKAPGFVHRSKTVSAIWQVAVSILGFAVLLAGIVMLVTPGPAFLLIPAGLAILATEYAWAERWFDKAKQAAQKAKEKAQQTSKKKKIATFLVGCLAGFAAFATYLYFFGVPSFLSGPYDWAQGQIDAIPPRNSLG